MGVAVREVSVSDIMIPGITSSGANVDDLVESIMEAERSTVTRMEQTIDRAEEERAAWMEIGRRISNLQRAARLLFGFENPFNERIATSSDESALRATARRNAPEGMHRITVNQLAEADRFISRNLPSDYQVQRGRYGFQVGDNEVHFSYTGGSLESFAQAVNQRAGDLVNARVVRNTANSKVILIETRETGSEKSLAFLETARSFALEAGILREVQDHIVQPRIQTDTVSGSTGPETRTIAEGTLTVGPGGNAAIDLPGNIPAEESVVMELEVKVRNNYRPWVPPDPPPGPRVPEPAAAALAGVRILSVPSTVPLPSWVEPAPPEVSDDLRVLYLRAADATIPLPELSDTDEFRKIQVPLGQYIDRIETLEIRNRNTHREIEVRNISIYDPRFRGDLAPVNAVGLARDAVVALEGIEVVRGTNMVDDLIDGVTLSLRAPTSRPVEIVIEPDLDRVTDALIQFAFYYNELMREINILTRTDRAIVDEITGYTNEERDEALRRLGLLQGDLSLNSLRTRLQTIMMNPYPTEAGNRLAMLAQTGISTNESGRGDGYSASRMRGYMEMNPREVDLALRTQFSAVRQLFGWDTDGDRVVDSGLAFEIERSLRPYTQSGGLIAIRTAGLDRSISDVRGRIEREETRLAQAEARYRADFARMEQSMRQMQENERSFQNMQSQMGGGR